MSKPERKPFAPLNDVDDDKIETLAREKGVGVLTRPAPREQGASAPEAPAPAAEALPPRSRMKAVSLELPGYVWTELKMIAVQRETSVRHVVMKALRRDGLTIEDADMVEDGRRRRGKSAPIR